MIYGLVCGYNWFELLVNQKVILTSFLEFFYKYIYVILAYNYFYRTILNKNHSLSFLSMPNIPFFFIFYF